MAVKFEEEMKGFMVEIQDVMLYQIEAELKKEKPEMRALAGLFKSMANCLNRSELENQEVYKLYVCAKSVLSSLENISTFVVPKAAMKLISSQTQLFKKWIVADAENFTETALQLCLSQNPDLKDGALDLFHSGMKVIAQQLDAAAHKDIFKKLLVRFQGILQEGDHHGLIIATIKAVGIFSKAIVTFMGQFQLVRMFTRMIELSELKILKDFQAMEEGEGMSKLEGNFKLMLKKQKQLISFVSSYAYLITNLQKVSETQLQHLYRLISIVFKKYRLLFQKYKQPCYEALAHLMMSLSIHQVPFTHLVKRIVRECLVESLKIPDDVAFAGESPLQSLELAVQLWKGWFSQEDIWTEFVCLQLYDELILHIISTIKDMNLSYNAVRHKDEQQQTEIRYVPINYKDQQYLVRLVNFTEQFVAQFKPEWFLRWLPLITKDIIAKVQQVPRVGKLYTFIKIGLVVAQEFKYFEVRGAIAPEVLATKNAVLSFSKQLIVKQQEYQEELLKAVLDMILHVPVAIIYEAAFIKEGDIDDDKQIAFSNRLHLWHPILLKTIELGLTDNDFGSAAVDVLDLWLSEIPHKEIFTSMRDVFPQLSGYLCISSGVDQDSNKKSFVAVVEEQHLNDQFWRSSRKKVTRRELAQKVLHFLGKLGGDAHSVVDSETHKERQSMNEIRWDSEWRLRCELPLVPHKRPLQIHLDAVLPKVLELARSGASKQTRISACEFLHALLLFMIGKSALGDKGDKRQIEAFGKIYARIFPVMLDIASDTELVSRQLFEPLVFQIIRWFASSRVYEHSEVMALLDAILEGSASKNNAQLRDLGAKCVAEFASWSLKQMSPQQIKDDPANIKSLIRRIQTHASHPDPFKRLSAILCFSKLVPIIREENALIDTFILEIADCVLANLKASSQHSIGGVAALNVSDQAKELLARLKRIILQKTALLIKDNDRRNIHDSLKEFLDFLLLKSTCAIEGNLRLESQKLWEECIVKLRNKKDAARDKIQSELSNGSLFQEAVEVEQREFGVQPEDPPLLSHSLDFATEFKDDDAQELKEQNAQSTFVNLFQQRNSRKRKVVDIFTAQLQIMGWMLKQKYLSLKELASKDRPTYNRFFKNIVFYVNQLTRKVAYNLSFIDSLVRMEGFRQQEAQTLIRSYYLSLIQFFHFFSNLSDGEFEQAMTILDKEAPQKKKKQPINRVVQLSIVLLLTPHVAGLELMMPDQSLERRLRKSIEQYLARCFRVQKMNISTEQIAAFLISSMPTHNLSSKAVLTAQSVIQMPPNRLAQFCLGYLKIFQIVGARSPDYQLIHEGHPYEAVYLSKWAPKLIGVINTLISHELPGVQEKARDFIKFIGKARLPFSTLITWLVDSPVLFQRTADLLLNYVASAWNDNECELAQNLVAFTGGDLEIDEEKEEKKERDSLSRRTLMLPLFIPFMQRLESHSPLFCSSLWEIIPRHWDVEHRWQIADIAQSRHYVDELGHQFRIYAVLSNYSLRNMKDAFLADGEPFLTHAVGLILFYLRNIKEIGVTALRDALTLTAIIYNLNVSINPAAVGRGVPHQRKHKVQLAEVSQHLRPALNNIITTFFPIHTTHLLLNSSQEANFYQLYQGLLLVLKVSQSQPAMTLLFRVIREERSSPRVYNLLKKGIKRWIVGYVAKLSCEKGVEVGNSFFEQFMDRELDKNIRDNLRFGILRRIVKPLLKYLSHEQLELFLVTHAKKMLEILAQKPSKFTNDPRSLFLLIRQKQAMLSHSRIYIFQILELLIRKLPSQQYKVNVHQGIYGDDTKGNELTRSVISTCHAAKKSSIESFSVLLQNPLEKQSEAKKEESEEEKKQKKLGAFYLSSQFVLEDIRILQKMYSSAAYACLATVILATQVKEQAFTQFLFQTAREKGEKLWENLIDYEFSDFDFKVITSYKVADPEKNKSAAEYYSFTEIGGGESAQNLVNQYISESFLAQSQADKTSVMVYETQPEQVEKSREEFLKKIEEMFPSQEKKKEQQQAGRPVAIPLELDPFNSHPVMLNLLRVIDHLSEKFALPEHVLKAAQDNISPDFQDMPGWMQLLLQEFKRHDAPLSLRLFFLKLLVNRAQIFAPFAHFWFEHIAEYIASRESGGRGLHYFMRDVCAVLLSWRTFVPENNAKNRQLCTNAVNALVKYSADKMKRVFDNNIQILGALIYKWKGLITVEKKTITTMLLMGEGKKPAPLDAHLWRMNAIQIMSFCLLHGVPVVPGTDANANYKYIAKIKNKAVAMGIEHGAADPLIQNLIVNFKYSRKAVVHSAAQTFGVLLKALSDAKSPEFDRILTDTSKILIEEIAGRGNQENFITIISKISLHFPGLLLHSRKLYLRFSQLISSFSGTFRAQILKTFRRLVMECRQENNIQLLDQVSICLRHQAQKLSLDVTPAHQQQFLYLIRVLLQMRTEEVLRLLESLFKYIKINMLVRCSDEPIRDLLVVTMVEAYDNFEPLQADARIVLVHSLGDSDPNIRKRAFSFWNRLGRLDMKDPVMRLLQVMKELYVPEDELAWLNNATSLVLAMAAQHDKFREQIYVKPLAECRFQPLSFTWNKSAANRSQPLIPLFQPSQIIQESRNEDEEKLLADDLERYLQEEEEEQEKPRPKKIHIYDTNNEQQTINLVGKESSGKQSTIDEQLKALFGSHEIVNTQEISEIYGEDSLNLMGAWAGKPEAVSRRKKKKTKEETDNQSIEVAMARRGKKTTKQREQIQEVKEEEEEEEVKIPEGMIRATQDYQQFMPTYLSAVPQEHSNLISASQRVGGQTLTELFSRRAGGAEAAIAQIQGDQDISKQLFVASPPFSQQPSDSLGSLSATLLGYFQRKGGVTADEGFKKPENPFSLIKEEEQPQLDSADFPASNVFSQQALPSKFRKGSKTLRKFFKNQHIQFAPHIAQQAGHSSVASIRHNPDGKSLTRSEIREKQQEEYLARQTKQGQGKQITLFRKYRTGELPDIEITHRDLLMPLFQLVRMDSSIAVEVFVLLFEELYLSETRDKVREELVASIEQILSSSKIFDYSTVSALHRVVISLNAESGVTLNSALISETGKRSLSYQSAALLLEQQLISYPVKIQEEKKKQVLEGLSQEQKLYRGTMMNLVDLYDEMGEEDAFRGVWRKSAKLSGFWINETVVEQKKKQKEEFKQVAQISELLNEELSKIAELIRDPSRSKESRELVEGIFEEAAAQASKLIHPVVSKELKREQIRCMAELSSWNDLTQHISASNYFCETQAKADHTPPPLHEISLFTLQMYLRAGIRSPQSWDDLRSAVQYWQSKPLLGKRGKQGEEAHDEKIDRTTLPQHFCYELAQIALTSLDFDRSLYYKSMEANNLLSAWSNMSRLSNHAKHKLVQRIQRLYELGDFLNLVKMSGGRQKKDTELSDLINRSERGWLTRNPSVAFDSLDIWDDVTSSRLTYRRILEKTQERRGRQGGPEGDLKEIEALLYVQIADGALKSGSVEASDAYMKLALSKRVDKDGINVRITEPIMKVKTKLFKVELHDEPIKEQIDRFLKLQKILEHQLEGKKYKAAVPLDTQIKLKMLEAKLDRRVGKLYLKQCRAYKKGNQTALQEYAEFTHRAFEKLEDVIKKCGNLVLEESLQLKQLAHYQFAKFLEKILRAHQEEAEMLEEGKGKRPMIDEALAQKRLNPAKLAQLATTHALVAINLGLPAARDMIPRLLDIVHKYEKVIDTFLHHSKYTPVWMFLRWSNQLMAIINRPESRAVAPKVVEMTEAFPQALYYPFKLLESNIDVDIMNLNYEKSELFTQLQEIFSARFQNLEGFVEALNCLVNPEHRFRYWLDVIKEVYGYDDERKRVQEYLKCMYNDCFRPQRPGIIGDRIGGYNKKFSKTFKDKFERLFGVHCDKVRSMDKEKFVQAMGPIYTAIIKSPLQQGKEKLSAYSEWLFSYEASSFTDPSQYIEIPGQYEETAAKGGEPNPGRNVKIASFSKTILILGSIRRPKRLTLHGSDEKEYNLLVKGGEDLRLDQRVQQLFQLMNQVFQNNPLCANRGLYLKTFQVIPMTNRLGVLQWVDNTQPLKEVVLNSLISKTGQQLISDTNAFKERVAWFKSIARDCASLQEQHVRALALPSDQVSDALRKHESKLPWDLLRMGLQSFCLTPQAFLNIKNNFIKSYGTFAICSYILGIGDRHLENFLIDVTDGEVLGIDFGIAFGSGVQLGVPEMVPFRLTRQIEGVLAPIGTDGTFRLTMIHALRALKSAKNLIMDCSEIFVKEPLLDWVKAAAAKSSGTKVMAASYESIHSQQDIVELQWYPRKKLDILSAKLEGISSTAILCKELEDTRHMRQKYGAVIMRDICGMSSKAQQETRCKLRLDIFARENKRRAKREEEGETADEIGGGLKLSLEDQVDCLIEQAGDRALTGKIWIGWSPYV